jgi:hypothetical protein
VGWALGGAGVAGLAVATVFGVIAAVDKSDDCTGSVCNRGTVAGIKSAALASDVGWISGGVLLASGAALVLFAPGARHEVTAIVKVAPAITASGGGLIAGGSS